MVCGAAETSSGSPVLPTRGTPREVPNAPHVKAKADNSVAPTDRVLNCFATVDLAAFVDLWSRMQREPHGWAEGNHRFHSTGGNPFQALQIMDWACCTLLPRYGRASVLRGSSESAHPSKHNQHNQESHGGLPHRRTLFVPHVLRYTPCKALEKP